jgi:hypothetical protein
LISRALNFYGEKINNFSIHQNIEPLFLKKNWPQLEAKQGYQDGQIGNTNEYFLLKKITQG